MTSRLETNWGSRAECQLPNSRLIPSHCAAASQPPLCTASPSRRSEMLVAGCEAGVGGAKLWVICNGNAVQNRSKVSSKIVCHGASRTSLKQDVLGLSALSVTRHFQFTKVSRSQSRASQAFCRFSLFFAWEGPLSWHPASRASRCPLVCLHMALICATSTHALLFRGVSLIVIPGYGSATWLRSTCWLRCALFQSLC
jgi:hypothetical protein